MHTCTLVKFTMKHYFVHKRATSWQKPTKRHVRPAKTQISLGICPIWSESSLSAWRKLGSLTTHWGHRPSGYPGWSESSLGAHITLLVLSWGGSNCVNNLYITFCKILFTVIIQEIRTSGKTVVTIIKFEQSSNINVSKRCNLNYKKCIPWTCSVRNSLGHVKQIWYLSPMRAAKVQGSLRIRAVSPEPPLLTHTSSESRGAFRQKARSLAPLNGC